MTTLNTILIICFIPGIILGLKKGFVGLLVPLAVIFIGPWVSFQFCPAVSELFIKLSPEMNPKVAGIISFIVLLVLFGLILGLLGRLITKIIKLATLGWVNRLLGFILATFETALILGLLICAFDGLNDKLEWVKPETLNGSWAYCHIKNFADIFFPYLKELLGK